MDPKLIELEIKINEFNELPEHLKIGSNYDNIKNEIDAFSNYLISVKNIINDDNNINETELNNNKLNNDNNFDILLNRINKINNIINNENNQHKQKQYHDGTRIYNQVYHCQKLRIKQNILRGDHKKGRNQVQHTVYRIF